MMHPIPFQTGPARQSAGLDVKDSLPGVLTAGAAAQAAHPLTLLKPRVRIYRSELLALSETFIAAQARALRSFEPMFAGLRTLPSSLALPGAGFPLTRVNDTPSRVARWLFLQTGHAPGWLQTLAEARPSLIHAHFATDAAEALPIARRLKLPMAVTLHGYDVMTHDQGHRATRRGRVYLARRARLFEQASLFFCVSESIRQRAMERGFPEAKLRVLPIGIDLDQFRPIPQAQRSPLVLFVGRLTEKKGCMHLVRAMAGLRHSVPAASLVIIGDGPERPRLEAAARELAPSTIFLGVQTSQQVRQWMSASRVLAVPSVTAANGDAEGLPTVLCEALAMGLPVAAFANSGIPELVRHEQEGLLAPERDEVALAENLARLCSDPALAARLGANGRERVTQQYDLHVQTARLERLYRSLLPAAGVPAQGFATLRAADHAGAPLA